MLSTGPRAAGRSSCYNRGLAETARGNPQGGAGMIRTLVNGAKGRMGREVVRAVGRESDMVVVGEAEIDGARTKIVNTKRLLGEVTDESGE